MEHADAKDLTLRLVRELLTEADLADAHAGVVIQAYLKDSRHDLAEVIEWSATRAVPVTVRLVKGAYWDTEYVRAKAEGWPTPVYERKVETDANYERCVRMLHDHHGAVRAAFGSHNLRSLAYAVAYARQVGIDDGGYELQMLHGMAEPVHDAVRRLGLRHRVYAPVGELVPGMAYLVRRLLENTSNESFVRHRFAEGQALDGLLAEPRVPAIPELEPPAARPVTDAASPTPYVPEPVAEWRRTWARQPMAAAIASAMTAATIDVPALIAGERVRAAATIDSVDPAAIDRVVGAVGVVHGWRCRHRGGGRQRRVRRLGRDARRRAGRGAVPSGGVAPAPEGRDRRSRGGRGRQAVGPGRRRRVRGDRLLRVLRTRGHAVRSGRRRSGAVTAR